MNKNTIEEMAREVVQYLIKNNLWSDTRVYFNNRAFATDDGNGKHFYNNNVFVINDINPADYFEYVNKDHILSMSYEGPLYHALNYYLSPNYCNDIESGLNSIFERYGCYAEYGDAWNLTLYKT